MSTEAMKQALEALESTIDQLGKPYSTQAQYSITSLRQAIAEAEKQEPVGYQDTAEKSRLETVPAKGTLLYTSPKVEQEPVAWRNAAIRVGEDLCSVGPFGYYDMTAEQWLDWALSVVTVHTPPPQRQWIGLTDEERSKIWGELPQTSSEERDACVFAEAIEIYLKERNT